MYNRIVCKRCVNPVHSLVKSLRAVHIFYAERASQSAGLRLNAGYPHVIHTFVPSRFPLFFQSFHICLVVRYAHNPQYLQ